MPKVARDLLEIARVLLDIGEFQPGFYLNLGRYQDDRDLKLSPPKGPYRTWRDAEKEIPKHWGAAGGIDRPKISFRIFAPYTRT